MKYLSDYNTKNLMKKVAFYAISTLFFGGIISCDSDSGNMNGGSGYLADAKPILIELKSKVDTDNT